MYTVRDVKTMCYRTLNQRWPSALVWDDSMIWYINMALHDIYTYEWRAWTFTKKKIVITESMFNELWWTLTSKITLEAPIIRILFLKDTSDRLSKFTIKYVDEPLLPWEISYDMYSKVVSIYNNNYWWSNWWYTLHYISSFDKLTNLDDIIPLPDAFIWSLYNLVMAYALNTYWQYWDNKTVTTYQAAQNQLKNLSQYDSFQITKVQSNIV